MAKRRHHRRHARKNPRRTRRNPDQKTWLIVGGAVALAGLYFFWPKKAAAAPSPAVTANCTNQTVMLNSYLKLLQDAKAACVADPNSKACSDLLVLGTQVNDILTKWPAECGAKPALPPG